MAITAAEDPYPSPRTDVLDVLYGVASIAIGVGLLLVGVAVRRQGAWLGWRRWVPLALGVWVFVPMTPAIMAGFVPARLAITGWMLLFAALAVVSVLMGRMILSKRQGRDSDAPHLNQRMQGYVGQITVLQEPIRAGRGKVTIDDTVWDVAGPDAPQGARVRISGVDGMRLLVEIL